MILNSKLFIFDLDFSLLKMENENAEIADLTNENPEEIPQESLVNEEEILNRIYLGDLEDLPSLTSKIVRIFTSSTFTGIVYILIQLSND